MGKAIKCDRCGICFDPFIEKDRFMCIKSYTVRNGEEFAHKECDYEENVDFCPKCTKGFFDFMSIKKGDNT